MLILETLLYSPNHQWIRSTGSGCVQIGLTDYAQQDMGEVLFVNLPAVGDTLTIDEPMGIIESAQGEMELLSPVTGEVMAVNTLPALEPGCINTECYDIWLVEVENTSMTDELLTPDEYEMMLEALGHRQ